MYVRGVLYTAIFSGAGEFLILVPSFSLLNSLAFFHLKARAGFFISLLTKGYVLNRRPSAADGGRYGAVSRPSASGNEKGESRLRSDRVSLYPLTTHCGTPRALLPHAIYMLVRCGEPLSVSLTELQLNRVYGAAEIRDVTPQPAHGCTRW